MTLALNPAEVLWGLPGFAAVVSMDVDFVLFGSCDDAFPVIGFWELDPWVGKFDTVSGLEGYVSPRGSVWGDRSVVGVVRVVCMVCVGCSCCCQFLE